MFDGLALLIYYVFMTEKITALMPIEHVTNKEFS